MCVNITAWKFDCDETLILVPGDHPLITKKSVVHYEDARFMQLDWIEQLLQKGTTDSVCVPRHACTYALMERLKQGLLDSKRTPAGIKDFCRAVWQGAPYPYPGPGTHK